MLRKAKELMRKTASVCTVLLAFMLMGAAGCQTVLIKDEAPPPIDNGQNRVETLVCGHHAVGNNVCWVGSQTAPQSVDFKIVTYLSGRVEVKSNGGGCSINEAIAFKDGQVIELDLSRYLRQFTSTCIVDVFMVVNFPGEKDTDVPTRGLAGRVTLAFSDLGKAPISNPAVLSTRPDDDDFYKGVGLLSLRQLSGPYTAADSIVIGTEGSKRGKVRIDATSCGLQPLVFDYNSENPALSYANLIRDKITRMGPCQLFGRVLRLDMNDDLVFAISLEVYSKKTVLLDEPIIQFSKDELRFQGSPEVSWSFVDREAVNSTKGKVETLGRTFTLRQLTAIGRTRVVKYENGVEVWMK